MKQVLEGSLPWEAAQLHVDRASGAWACEPACPSGVSYRDLISPFRALGKSRERRSISQRLTRFLTSQTIPYPGRFKVSVGCWAPGKNVIDGSRRALFGQ